MRIQGYRKDPGQIATYVDLQFVVFRRQDDLLHQRADNVGRRHPFGLGILLQGIVQFGELNPVMGRHVRMQQGRGLLGTVEEQIHFFSPALKADHLLIEALGCAALQDQVQKRVQLPVDAFDLGLGGVDRRTSCHAQTVHLVGELVAERLEQGRVHQVVAQGVEHARLQAVAADVLAVVAGALVARRRAAEQIGRDHRVTATAAAASGQPRKQIFGTPAVAEMVLAPTVIASGEFEGGLACLGRTPQIVRDNAQLGHLLDDPFGVRVRSCLTFAGVGILDEALAIPDQLADVHLVVEDAVAAPGAAVEGAEAPIAATWGGDPVLVQRDGDALGRFAGDVVAEDPADHLRLGRVDGAVAAHRLAIGI